MRQSMNLSVYTEKKLINIRYRITFHNHHTYLLKM